MKKVQGEMMSSEKMPEVTARILEVMKSKRLDQNALAEKWPCTRQNINNLLRKEVYSRKVLKNFARVLEVSEQWLLTGASDDQGKDLRSYHALDIDIPEEIKNDPVKMEIMRKSLETMMPKIIEGIALTLIDCVEMKGPSKKAVGSNEN